MRSGPWFHIDVPMDNSAADLFETLGVTGVVAADKGDPAPVNYVETAERDVFLPQDPETFTYDTDGRRLRKETAGWDAASQTFVPAADTRFVHNQWTQRGSAEMVAPKAVPGGLSERVPSGQRGSNLLAEIDGGGAVLRSYLWGASPDGRLETTATPGALAGYRDHGTGAFHFAQADGNPAVGGTGGNVTHLINAADGSLSGRYTYGAFGDGARERGDGAPKACPKGDAGRVPSGRTAQQPLAAEGDAARANPLRFSSKYTDASTGLLYYGYRFYDPSNGRWLNWDPIGEMGGLNLYGMVGNNPISWYDFLGLTALAVDCGCDGGGNKIEPETDDSGRQCCPDDLEFIFWHYEKPSYLKGEVGHSWVETTTGESCGYYPAKGGLNTLRGPGEVRDDSGRSPNLSITYIACPESVEELKAEIDQTALSETTYDVSNAGGRSAAANCTGWSREWLKNSGFVVSNIGRGGGPGQFL